jgi:hypothetical protein
MEIRKSGRSNYKAGCYRTWKIRNLFMMMATWTMCCSMSLSNLCLSLFHYLYSPQILSGGISFKTQAEQISLSTHNVAYTGDMPHQGGAVLLKLGQELAKQAQLAM